ncbi:hypothetical protein ID866_10970 [Astraeus odoratus]|nr:hypothetical protein ID866_10970 [Astraeus odoratus]
MLNVMKIAKNELEDVSQHAEWSEHAKDSHRRPKKKWHMVDYHIGNISIEGMEVYIPNRVPRLARIQTFVFGSTVINEAAKDVDGSSSDSSGNKMNDSDDGNASSPSSSAK